MPCCFAGATVCVALLGLFAVGVDFLYGPALAASLAVLVTMAASLTLLPAMLSKVGPRIDRLRLPGHAGCDAARRAACGRAGAPRSSAGRGPLRSPPSSCSCPRDPGPLDRDRQRRRRHRSPATRPAARPTTCSPRASAPASTGRCSSSATSRRQGAAATAAELQHAVASDRRRRRRPALPVASRRARRPADPRLPDDRPPGARRPRSSSTGSATRRSSPSTRRPAPTPTSAARRRSPTTSRPTSPASCRCSSGS